MQIEKNLRDRNTMSPEDFRTKPVFSSSLNSIPGNEQMQIANDTQEQFSFDNAKGETSHSTNQPFTILSHDQS